MDEKLLLKFDRKHCIQDEISVARFVAMTIPIPVTLTDHRWHVNHVWVDSKHAAVSSDGGRLHRVSEFIHCGQFVPSGWYSVLKCSKTMVWLEKSEEEDSWHTFPDFKEIIEGPGHRADEFLTLFLNPTDMSYIYAAIIRAMRTSYINYRYLEELCELELSVCVEIWNTNGRTDLPLRIEARPWGDTVLTAMLMPIRGE